MLRNLPRAFAVASTVLLAPLICRAQVPNAIPFQGMLTTKAGIPVTNATQSIALSLYGAATGGTAVYTENQSVAVTRGVFSTTIGNGNPTAYDALPFNVPYWVAVRAGGDVNMTPRIPLSAVPYANFAQTVAYSGIVGAPASLPPGGPAGGDLTGSYPNPSLSTDPTLLYKVSGSAMTSDGSRIGIDTTSPSAALDVNGELAIRGSNTLDFGAGIAGKEANAGKIGYGAFTLNTLDIVGAGASASQRRIKFHNEGGASFSGYLGIGTDAPQTPLHVKGNGPVMILEGSDHAYLEYYPRGFNSGRKGYIGFPGAGSHDLAIANEDTGVVEVVGTFVNNSDRRYKTNIARIPNALNDVLNLKGVSYDWRKDLPGFQSTDHRQIGFLAQDVEKVLPELVYQDAKGYKSVAYVNVVPVLVEAMKDQQKEIAALRKKAARADDLEARLKRLERIVSRLAPRD